MKDEDLSKRVEEILTRADSKRAEANKSRRKKLFVFPLNRRWFTKLISQPVQRSKFAAWSFANSLILISIFLLSLLQYLPKNNHDFFSAIAIMILVIGIMKLEKSHREIGES